MRNRPVARGFSLIELMIAVVLGLLSIAAVGSVFMYGSRNYKQDDRVSRMQDELRFGMAQLTQDLEMAGFWAQVRDPLNDPTLSTASGTVPALVDWNKDCGPTTDGAGPTALNNWTFQERRASLMTLGNVASGSAAHATFPCIDDTEFYAGPNGLGTDIVAIKRLGGGTVDHTAPNACTAPTPPDVACRIPNNMYVQTNGIVTTIYKDDGSALPTNVDVYEYRPLLWFVRKFAFNNQSPAVPSLCRKTLTGNAYTTDCVAQGIESMQLEFGFDANSDGVPDYFTEYASGVTPTLAELSQIIAIRVHLLARSIDPSPDPGYSNNKTYNLAGFAFTPSANGCTPITTAVGAVPCAKFFRRAVSTVVVMRNQANRLSPFALPE